MKLLLNLIIQIALISVAISAAASFEFQQKSSDVNPLVECSQNYTPCSCQAESDGPNVVCVNADTEDVKNAFRLSFDTYVAAFSYFLETTSPQELVAIPFDLFADKKVASVEFVSSSDDTFRRPDLVIDASAFRYTRRYTSSVRLEHWDLKSQVDFEFLNGFEALQELHFNHNYNISAFQLLPTLPALKTLEILSCPAIKRITFPYLTPARLQRLVISNSSLDDPSLDDIMSSLSSSTSFASIEQLDLSINKLTVMPRQIRGISLLTDLNLSLNRITTVPQFGLLFNVPVTSVDLSSNEIASLDAGAFNGNFTSAVVNLKNNLLTTFEEEVFKQVLEQMTSATSNGAEGGFIDVESNPFECGCDMKWLVVNRPELLPAVRNGVCSDSTKFEELDETWFTNCSTPPTTAAPAK